MKEYPILFTTEMVQAILEGRKTQTRRVIKGKWLPLVEEVLRVNGQWVWETLGYELTTPYGRPDDRLWVREAWRIIGWDCENGEWKIEYKDGSHSGWLQPDTDEEWETKNFIRCTDECLAAGIPEDEDGFFQFSKEFPCPTKWRSSRFILHWASRITLEIVNIRVERVQNMKYDDFKKEGMKTAVDGRFAKGRNEFITVWDKINAKRGYGWDVNPLVWVIEFKVIHE